MAHTFPTTLSDLNFRDDTVSPQSLYRSMRDLRKATLSIPNRLRSILQDAEFVQQVVQEHSSDGARRPLIANERCGSWYIPPDRKVGSAYFKSTDGHFGQWDFSLRRLNLQVLSIVGKHEGAVIVDSTRRGKSMPDAFAKTVPIWVAVMNRVLFPHGAESHAFQRPPEPYLLGDSEVSQIEGRLEGFVKALKRLGLDFEKLRQEVGRPMKVFWRVNDSTGLNTALGHDSGSEGTPGNHYPIILCSASRRVVGAEMSEGSYIQGAGDDSEGWSRGLTPALFWQHKDELLNKPESELESLISMLIVDARKDYMPTAAVRIAPTWNLYIAKAAVGDSGVLGQAERNAKTGSEKAQKKGASEMETETKFDLVISCNRTNASTPAETRLDLECRTGKLGSRDLREKLGLIRDLVQVRLERVPGASILVTCETGKDLCVGVALMLLSLLYDDEGRVILTPRRYVCSTVDANDGHDRFPLVDTIDKSFIRRRLAWIVSSNSDASPSRTTLQSVNAFLIERPRLSILAKNF
jgi:tRNA A64-2'-O-ribosylphosphate transferase